MLQSWLAKRLDVRTHTEIVGKFERVNKAVDLGPYYQQILHDYNHLLDEVKRAYQANKGQKSWVIAARIESHG